MTRAFKLILALPAAFALAIGAGTAAAQEKTEVEKLGDRLKEFEKKVTGDRDNTDSAVKNLSLDILELRNAVKDLKDRVDAAPKPPATSDGTARKMPLTAEDELRKKLEKAERDIADLRAQLNDGRATSKRIDGTAAKMGQVRFVSTYDMPVTVVLNGRMYDLAPMRELTVNAPSGTFTYQIPQSQAYPVMKPLRDGETFTVNIRN